MAASSSIFSDTSPVRSFDASFEFERGKSELNPGCTVQVTIHGGTVKAALSLPRQALFQKDGKPCVYVREAEGWGPFGIRVKCLTESRMVVEGIAPGAEVALVNQELLKDRTADSVGLSSILGGFQDLNNLVLAPIESVLYRLEDNRSYMRDEIDGLYLQIAEGEDLGAAAGNVRGILNSSHRNAGDFSLASTCRGAHRK